MTTDITRLSALGKAEQADVAQKLATNIVEGEVPALEAYQQLKAIIATAEAVTKRPDVMDTVIREFERYGQRTVTMHGSDFQEKEVGVRYDFSVTGDPVWTELNRQIAGLTDKRKEREAFLRTLKSAATWLDEETGEVYRIVPPLKTSTTSITVTFK